MKDVIIIYGPTGIGKTKTSINLAKALNGEIISADSMQIYKNMDIGTAKITKQEMQGVKHYLIDVCSPKRKFTACDFVNKCETAIEEILSKNKQPIIVGGTGLYLKSLIEGYDFNGVYKDEKLRKKYKNLAEKFGNEYIFNILKEKNPKRAEQLNVNDTLRVVRALEILELKKEEKVVLKQQ
ncbi:MAG: tRNA (adenosine(37)-N6)-dimethylallyltransferase MiaA, partial [Clostridia bacterium]|nr:tRNA (adenosine(37)-N6)-dimethylallyltransferase MiaA [Clostridia bacterium]